MATLEQEIRDLKARIEGYEQEYADASPEDRKELRPLITARTNALIQQQQQQQQAQADGEGQGQAAKRQRILTSTKFETQSALDEQGQFVTVGQKGAAGFSSEDSVLYVRAETVELWNALNGSHNDGLNISVDGPPGTGKSTEVWAWILWKAKQDKITVTWIHLTRNTMVKVVINGAEGLITTGYGAKKDIIEYSEGSLLVVDGVVAKNQSDISCDCYSWATTETGRRFVLVSSSSVAVAVQEDLEANIVRFTVASWILDQYREACDNEEFFKIVEAKLKCPGSGDSKEELLLSKYYFAGGCARWMFEFDYWTWKKDFDIHLNRVDNYEELFTSAGGENTPVAVNHLRGVTLVTTEEPTLQKSFFFISQHAVAKLAEKCEKKETFFIHSYAKADKAQNQAYKGWIFEFDFDYQLQNAKKGKLNFYDSLPTGQGTVDEYIEFSSVPDLGTAIKSLEVGNVLWAKPQLWCEKAYDFLCFWKDDADVDRISMVVVNVTVAQTHSVLLYVVNSLASALGSDEIGAPISAIRFDFAIPIDVQFTGGDIEGRLCEWSTMNGMKWPNYVSFNQYVDAQCIKVVRVAQTTGTA